MFSCVTSKFSLFCCSRLPSSFNNLQECVALFTQKTNFSTSSNLFYKSNGPKNWLAYNKVLYPPQEPGEESRPAVCYFSDKCLQNCVTQSSLFIVTVCVSSKAKYKI